VLCVLGPDLCDGLAEGVRVLDFRDSGEVFEELDLLLGCYYTGKSG
jgi:hypothetical protein